MTTQNTPKTALIFGVTGQDGAYLAQFLLQKGYRIFGTSRDAEMAKVDNMERLGVLDQVGLRSCMPTDAHSVVSTLKGIRPDEIYNLSGQSSVGLSFDQPAETFNSIALGTLNILDAIRSIDPKIRFYNAGSGECFGDTGGVPATESSAFHPFSPYAVAKAAAFWQVATYRASYDLYACSGILFNHESPLRPQRFVTQKIIAAAAGAAQGNKDKLVVGDVSICRDWGWAPEYVEAMWLMLNQDQPEDYVIATGQSHSLEDFIAQAYSHFGLDYKDYLEVDPSLFRPNEIKHGIGDASKAAEQLGWKAKKALPEIISDMAEAEMAAHDVSGEHKTVPA